MVSNAASAAGADGDAVADAAPAPTLLFRLADDGRVVECTATATALLGRAVAPGASLFDHVDDAAALAKSLAGIDSHAIGARDLRLLRADGATVSVAAVLGRASDGGITLECLLRPAASAAPAGVRVEAIENSVASPDSVSSSAPSPLLRAAGSALGQPHRRRERRSRRPPVGDRCGECLTTHSTEWRKGPDPNAMLCNACGLRFTRRCRREQRERARLTAAVRLMTTPANAHSQRQDQHMSQFTVAVPPQPLVASIAAAAAAPDPSSHYHHQPPPPQQQQQQAPPFSLSAQPPAAAPTAADWPAPPNYYAGPHESPHSLLLQLQRQHFQLQRTQQPPAPLPQPLYYTASPQPPPASYVPPAVLMQQLLLERQQQSMLLSRLQQQQQQQMTALPPAMMPEEDVNAVEQRQQAQAQQGHHQKMLEMQFAFYQQPHGRR